MKRKETRKRRPEDKLRPRALVVTGQGGEAFFSFWFCLNGSVFAPRFLAEGFVFPGELSWQRLLAPPAGVHRVALCFRWSAVEFLASPQAGEPRIWSDEHLRLCVYSSGCVGSRVGGSDSEMAVLPKRVERLLRKQGLRGNSYRLLYGNFKDLSALRNQARSKPKHPSTCHTPAPSYPPPPRITEFGKPKMNPAARLLAPGLAM
ncbi:hypothetical protein V2J09_006242 [Rumex salicifolius]